MSQPRKNPDQRQWLGKKPEDIFEQPPKSGVRTWEINWNENLNINDGKVVMHSRSNGVIDISIIWSGSQPPGAPANMIVDSIRNIADVQNPTTIRMSRISEKPPLSTP